MRKVLASLGVALLLAVGGSLGHASADPAHAFSCGGMNYVYNYGHTYTVNVWFVNLGRYYHVNLRTDTRWDGGVCFEALTWEWSDSPNTWSTEGVLVARTGGGNAGGGTNTCSPVIGNYDYCWGPTVYGNSAWADDYWPAQNYDAWVDNPDFWSPSFISGYTNS